MKRDEEIIAEAQKHGLNCMSRINYQDGFIEGAKWADKTMIEKACNWIKEHVMIPYEGKFDGSETSIIDYLEWCKDRLEEAERITNEFKKAMES